MASFVIGLVILGYGVVSVLGQSGQGDPRPNIVFVLADDYGFNDVGYHGSRISTPVLDRLVVEGVRLENYYVQPVCSPTRGQLMSGRYDIHTGLQHGVITERQPNALPADSPTIAEKLKEAGYSTHMMGKWHLGYYEDRLCPWNRGFDTFFGYLNGDEDYYTHSSNGNLDLRDGSQVVRNESGHYSAHMYSQKAVDLIHTLRSDKPFFLYLALQSVHGPMQVPERYKAQYSDIKDATRQTYAGMVAAMDEGIGNVTQALKETGLWNNTVFIFSSDNGGKKLKGGNNWPLRGEKGGLWEGGIRAVGFVSGGVLQKDKTGVINRELMHVSDWFPTFVRLANGNLNGTKPLDGVDQWDTISKGSPSKRTVILHNIDPLAKKGGARLYNDTFDNRIKAAIRMGDFKLLTGYPGMKLWNRPPEALLTVAQPSIHDDRDKNIWLFNVTADPNEYADLSDVMPGQVRLMLDKLAEYEKTAVPARNPSNDPQCRPKQHGHVWGPWRIDSTTSVYDFVA